MVTIYCTQEELYWPWIRHVAESYAKERFVGFVFNDYVLRLIDNLQFYRLQYEIKKALNEMTVADRRPIRLGNPMRRCN